MNMDRDRNIYYFGLAEPTVHSYDIIANFQTSKDVFRQMRCNLQLDNSCCISCA